MALIYKSVAIFLSISGFPVVRQRDLLCSRPRLPADALMTFVRRFIH